jgi:hypothetical protein
MGAAFLKWLCRCLLCALLVGCTPQATPIAPVISTPLATPAQTVTDTPFLRYAIAPELMRWLPDSIRASRVMLETYDGSTIEGYDLIVTYGEYAGWQQAPVSHLAALLINPERSPLDQPEIRELLTQAINPQTIISLIGRQGMLPPEQPQTRNPLQIREQLANLGYPDGISLTLVSEHSDLMTAIQTQLQSTGFLLTVLAASESDVRERFASGRANLALIVVPPDALTSWSSTLPAQITQSLFTIPISYLAREDLPIIFTENGLPIVPD